MSDYIQIGYTKKTHGVKGALRLLIYDAYEDDALNNDCFFLEINNRYVPYFVQSVDKDKWLVQFEDVASKEVATALTSKGIFLQASDVVEKESNNDSDLEAAFLKGYELHDINLGRVGEIVDILEFPQQEMALLVIDEKEIFIPINEHLIHQILEEEQKIIFDLPEGILDL